MSEIIKLYENAGVKLKKVCTNADCDCDEMLCDECEYFKDNIFAFTAEKQIELIKWLGKNKNGFGLFNDGTEGLCCRCDFHREWFREDFYAEDFENALAGLINTLWQDLTEEEKQQIKEILE